MWLQNTVPLMQKLQISNISYFLNQSWLKSPCLYLNEVCNNIVTKSNMKAIRPERKAIQLGCVVLDKKIAPEAGLKKVYNEEDA
jgi:hypothetical protein